LLQLLFVCSFYFFDGEEKKAQKKTSAITGRWSEGGNTATPL
jgi:hypothetical protein